MPEPQQPSHFSAFIARNFTSSWLYPLKGITYWARHRYLWPLLRSRLIPLAVLSLCLTSLLFATVYLPQVALLALFQGKSAWFNATILVLGETNLVVAIVFEAFFVDRSQVDCFDAILVARGHEGLVRTLRVVEADDDHESGSSALSRLGQRDRGAVYAPFSLRQIVEFVLVLPLNLIPFVGVPMFLLLTGYRAGPLLHARYFALRFTKAERKAFIRTHRWKYTWFGFTALLLQLVPVLSLFFLFTTAAGSALWAADIENQARRTQDQPEVQHAQYVDEP